MKRNCVFLLILAPFLLPAVSCRQLYTTSIAAPLARDGITISSGTSIGDLVSLAEGDAAADTDTAKAVLSVLGDKSAADIEAMSVASQTAILNLATTATVSIKTLTDLASEATASGADTDQLISDAFDAFDSSVNLTAIETILGDTDALGEAPADTLIFASATVLADVAEDIGSSTTLMDVLKAATDPVAPVALDDPSLGLTADQQDRIALVIGVKDALDARPAEDLASVTFGDFNLIDLLNGTQGT